MLSGALWWVLWTLIDALCANFIAFNIARAMSGIGAAMIMPNAVTIIGTTFSPGKMRSIGIALFGAGAPIGGWAGSLCAGLLVQLTPWKWLFVLM